MHCICANIFGAIVFNLRFKIDAVVIVIWSIVIIINSVLTLQVSTDSLPHDREPCKIKVVSNHTCSLHTCVCAGSRRVCVRLSGFGRQRRESVQLLGVSSSALFRSGSVPNNRYHRHWGKILSPVLLSPAAKNLSPVLLSPIIVHCCRWYRWKNLSLVSLSPAIIFSGVKDTGEKFIVGINNTGALPIKENPWQRLIAGVIDTANKFVSHVVDTAEHLIAGVVDTADKHSFAIIFANFRKKMKWSLWNTQGLGGTDSRKIKLKSKILCQTPFKKLFQQILFFDISLSC
jgi:hypothetical protein